MFTTSEGQMKCPDAKNTTSGYSDTKKINPMWGIVFERQCLLIVQHRQN